jgi:hypothetical protein
MKALTIHQIINMSKYNYLFGNFNRVINFYFTASQNFREDSFSGHDTISDCIKDVAPVVADFADL